MNPELSTHITYLLRLWRAGSEDGPGWRAVLENPHSGERQVFGDLTALFAFIEERTRSPRPGGDATPRAAPGAGVATLPCEENG